MDTDLLNNAFKLFYAIGEILTMTWPGRIVLGMAVGSMLARIARS
jgi:hypothetical protein